MRKNTVKKDSLNKEKTKIPKIIHYVWFGKGKPSELMQKCINSWKEQLPEYEIMEWNEENFDINYNTYTREAYNSKKWAFVSDVARLYALYHHGGVYMDTDVEVLKPIDEFLNHSAFSGFEDNNFIPTGIMAACKGNKWIQKLLDDYKSRKFINENGELDLKTNVARITEITCENYDIELNNTYQDLKDVVFYPSEYFCPKNWATGDIKVTPMTYVIHHFSSSWQTPKEQKRVLKYQKLVKKHGKEKGEKIFHRWDFLCYFLWPFKALANPKKALKKLNRILNKRKNS